MEIDISLLEKVRNAIADSIDYIEELRGIAFDNQNFSLESYYIDEGKKHQLLLDELNKILNK